MGRSGVVAVVLAMVAVVGATVGDNTLDGGDRIVLVAPVLAPRRTLGLMPQIVRDSSLS